MHVDVDVDLGSAVISYGPAAGEERCLSAERVSLAALFEAAPWPTFRWYFGRRHYSGNRARGGRPRCVITSSVSLAYC